MRAFTGGTIGSASPERTSTRARIRCSQGRLVQPAAAVVGSHPTSSAVGLGGRSLALVAAHRRRPRRAARKEGAGAAKERRGVVAQRCREQGERVRVTGHSAQADRRRGEHEPPDACLGLSSASCWATAPPNDTPSTSASGRPRTSSRRRPDGRAGARAGDETGRRLAGARCVVGDRLDAVLDEGVLQRAPHLDVAAQAHHQQQWTALASHRDAAAGGRRPGRR